MSTNKKPQQGKPHGGDRKPHGGDRKRGTSG